nr:hypothetical protein BaRGS_027333 [Batillaria attramentaria]
MSWHTPKDTEFNVLFHHVWVISKTGQREKGQHKYLAPSGIRTHDQSIESPTLYHSAIPAPLVANGKRVIVVPMPFTSHTKYQTNVARALARLGHEVWLTMPDFLVAKGVLDTTNFTVIEYSSVGNVEETFMTGFRDKYFKREQEDWASNFELLKEHCHSLLTNESFYNTIKAIRPEFFVVDNISMIKMLAILPYRLGRLQNVLFTLLSYVHDPRVYPNAVALYAPEMPYLPIDMLVARAEIWLVEMDHILDYPRPSLPNVKLIGGTATGPAKPLPSEFKTFMDSATEGVVIVSFGSYVLNLPKKISDKVFSVLQQLPFKSVFRSNLKSPNPAKILTSPWLPQNDLLGHQNTKVFVSHCGKNGQYEALFHAVPVVATPMFADQPYNAERMRVKSMAETVDLKTVTEDAFKSAIMTVATDPRYKQAISTASELFRIEFGVPMERAAFWLDHVMKYGDGKRVIVVPMPFTSHTKYQTNVARALARLGHEVWLTMPDFLVAKGVLDTTNFTVIEYSSVGNVEEIHMTGFRDKYFTGEREDWALNFKLLKEHCHSLLTNVSFYNTIKAIHPEFFVFDNIPMIKMLTILPYRLGVPFAFVGSAFDPETQRVPQARTVTPIPLFPFSDHMTFVQRLQNVLFSLISVVRDPSVYPNAVALYAPEMPYLPIDMLVARAEIWLVEMDHILDYPRPSLPNVKLIGGTATGPAKPLPSEFKTFMDSATEGVVIVSFGSYVLNLPKEISDKVFSVLQQLPFKSVFRSNLKSPNPAKILTSPWLPQNDLLGHPNTKVFVSHCGKNGQYEALFHAVPVVATPMFVDQPYNAERMRVKSMAETVDLKTVTEDAFKSAIMTVATDPRYKQAISTASELFRIEFGVPMERAAFWLDHVMKYGD